MFQIEQFECVLKDPFHLLTVHLPVFDKLKTEIIVYPSPKEVAGLQELQQLLTGSYRTNFSFTMMKHLLSVLNDMNVNLSALFIGKHLLKCRRYKRSNMNL